MDNIPSSKRTMDQLAHKAMTVPLEIAHTFIRPGTPEVSTESALHVPKTALRNKVNSKSGTINFDDIPGELAGYELPDDFDETDFLFDIEEDELPHFAPNELHPDELALIMKLDDPGKCTEVHFAYRSDGHSASVFALRFSEEGNLPDLAYATRDKQERYVARGSVEYDVRISQLKELVSACIADESSYSRTHTLQLWSGKVVPDQHDAARSALEATTVAIDAALRPPRELE